MPGKAAGRLPGIFRDPTGFTLLEVMASVAILGVSIVVIIQLFSGGLRLTRAMEEHTGAVILAMEKMTETILSEDLKEGQSSGTAENGLGWTVEITPYDADRDELGGKSRLFTVAVIAAGPGKGGAFTLTSIKTVSD